MDATYSIVHLKNPPVIRKDLMSAPEVYLVQQLQKLLLDACHWSTALPVVCLYGNAIVKKVLDGDKAEVVTKNGSVYVIETADYQLLAIPPVIEGRQAPVEQSSFSIICGDSAEVLPDKRYRMAIFSPPYNECRPASSFYGSGCPDDMSDGDHADKLVGIVKQLTERVDIIVMNLNYFDRNPSHPDRIAIRIEDETGWKYKRFYWEKPRAHPTPMFPRVTEHVFAFSKNLGGLRPLRPRHGHAPWYEELGWEQIQSTKIETSANTDRYRRQSSQYKNDATFPEEFVQKCLATWARPGDSVIDPFAGSGTTGIVCRQAGVHVTLIDIDPKACAEMNKWVGASRCLFQDTLYSDTQAAINLRRQVCTYTLARE